MSTVVQTGHQIERRRKGPGCHLHSQYSLEELEQKVGKELDVTQHCKSHSSKTKITKIKMTR